MKKTPANRGCFVFYSLFVAEIPYKSTTGRQDRMGFLPVSISLVDLSLCLSYLGPHFANTFMALFQSPLLRNMTTMSIETSRMRSKNSGSIFQSSSGSTSFIICFTFSFFAGPSPGCSTRLAKMATRFIKSLSQVIGGPPLVSSFVQDHEPVLRPWRAKDSVLEL